jgi:hypothetical protein
LSLGVRSLIAIGSLIAVPAIAVVGVSAPRALHQAKHAYKPVVAAADAQQPVGDDSSTGETSPDVSSDPRTGFTAGEESAATDRSAGASEPNAARPAAVFWGASAPRPTTDRSPESLRHRADAVNASTPSAVDARASGDGLPESINRQTAYVAEVPHRLQPTAGRRENGGAPDRFTALEHRLRDLGATHYRLETWGDEGELFRFRCMMAVPGRANHNRYFEATDPEALGCMERVLAQIERWHAGL